MHQIIHIHPEAPPKPAQGAPCNGCGVCCLAEPCPVGVIVSRRRHGACEALVWSDEAGCYRCGLLVVEAAGDMAWWRRWPRALWLRWARRMISAGSGCDASLEVASTRAASSED
ncbi:MAG: hypothetical protein EPO09_19655 [Aquabacterium sp.]|uniref:hypothetical protein n=1 Tax=Aquabacterium sp. TaxID=1872578 RepID=UPI00120F0D3A|nr:hypothetical protein [Aquabacterium sp.]TAK86544.1 MAG: hypothetical protein EPO09_19655 [Aquabacterium sp.]